MNLCECQFYECLMLFELMMDIMQSVSNLKILTLKLLVHGYRIDYD
jgi:hypothetical protein